MRGVRWTGGSVEVAPVPEPEGDGVVLDVVAASICGTDLHFLREAGQGFVMGHEFAGTVDGIGYAVEPTVFCGTCTECRSGSTQRCTDGRINIGISRDGGLADRVLVPEYALVPLPDGLAVDDARLVEPASVSWHGVRRAGLLPGERVAVVGGGTIGLLAGAAARQIGRDAVAVETRHRHQRVAAEQLGLSSPRGEYDVVIDAAGSESALARCGELVRPGGRVVLLGVSAGILAVPGVATLVKEITWVGSMGRCRHDGVRESDEAAALLAAHPEIARTLITHRFPLDDAAEAFRVAGDKTSGALKVVLQP
jgi:2-desacetyl-2-hydroxyethyl bacteriochlorophyllide A dehydrogenase